jgi:hypothetical protein
MPVKQVYNLLSEEELSIINRIVNNIKIPIKEDGSYIYDIDEGSSRCNISKSLGRLQTSIPTIAESEETYNKLVDLCKASPEQELEISSIAYVEYNGKYGIPALPPHFDADSSEFIVNFQLDSNTYWDIGVDFDTYKMENNSAVIFQPNTNIHWRPHKKFKDGEYVKMIFFRVAVIDEDSIVDNSHLRYTLDHKVYKEVNKFRDSLKLLNNI